MNLVVNKTRDILADDDHCDMLGGGSRFTQYLFVPEVGREKPGVTFLLRIRRSRRSIASETHNNECDKCRYVYQRMENWVFRREVTPSFAYEIPERPST